MAAVDKALSEFGRLDILVNSKLVKFEESIDFYLTW